MKSKNTRTITWEVNVRNDHTGIFGDRDGLYAAHVSSYLVVYALALVRRDYLLHSLRCVPWDGVCANALVGESKNRKRNYHLGNCGVSLYQLTAGVPLGSVRRKVHRHG